MKRILLSGLFVLTVARVAAVNPTPLLLGVNFSPKTDGSSQCTVTAAGEPGDSVHTDSTEAEGDMKTAWLRPGKTYAISLDFEAFSTLSHCWVSFIAPDGYAVYLDGIPVDVVQESRTNGQAIYDYLIELRPIGNNGPAAAASFSGIDLGKAVAWQIGLGGIRNGSAAGRINFREFDLATNAPANRERLFYDPPANDGQITVVRDGPSTQTLRQIMTPQSFVDIINLTGTANDGYTVKFYTPAEGSWNGSTHVFDLVGSPTPWKTIKVETPGSSQLKITETEGSVSRLSHLSLTSGTVASGAYVWTLQEGDTTPTWLRTTTHTSTIVNRYQRDDVVVVRTGGTGGTIVSKTKYRYNHVGVLNTHDNNSMIYDSTTFPLTVTPSASVNFNATVMNSGYNAWGANHCVVLRDSGLSSVTTGSVTGISPGNSTTVALSFTAPSSPGTYTYYLQGRETGVEWFGSSATLSLIVAASGSSGTTNTMRYNTTTFPLSVLPGATVSFNSNITNTGTNTYGANHFLVLRDSGLNNLSFADLNGLAPSASTTGTLNFTAPTTPGTYTYTIQGLEHLVTFFPTSATLSLIVQDKDWGEELYQVVADPDTAQLTTKYLYLTYKPISGYAASRGNYRRVESITDPNGNWTGFAYNDGWNDRGLVQYEFHPYLDTPSDASALHPWLGFSREWSYIADWSGRYRIPNHHYNYVEGDTTTFNSTSATLNQGSGDKIYTQYQADAYYNDTDYQRTTSQVIDARDGNNPDYFGQLLAVKRPDLSQDSFAHYRGGYNYSTKAFTSGSGSPVHLRTICWHGSASSSGADSFSSYDSGSVPTVYLLANKSTMDVSIRNPAGLVVRTETHVYIGSGSFTLMTWENFTYDSAGRLTQRVASNDAVADYHFANGRMDYSVDVDGTRTDFTYDELGRVATSKKLGVSSSGSYAAQGDITTTYTYDGAGRVTQTVVSGGALALTSTATYDLAGRPTQQVQNSGSARTLTTGCAYDPANRRTTVTFPGGATQVTDTFLDGRPSHVHGTGVVEQNYQFWIDSGTGRSASQVTPGGINPFWTNRYFDWLGRKTEEWTQRWDGYAHGRFWTYGSTGLLTKFEQPGLADTLYEYDTMGVLKLSGLDIGGNDALDYASDDRITATPWSIVYGSGWHLLKDTWAYGQSGSGSGALVSRVDTWLSGLPSNRLGRVDTYDVFSNMTVTTVDVDRTNHLVTTTTDAPDSSTDAVQTAYNGLLVQSVDTAGISLLYGYDALGRQTTTTDPRTGTSTTAFISGTNLVSTVTDAASVTQATYAYDSAGRVDTVTNALSKVCRYGYNNRGQVVHQWGDTDYPVENVYDSLGRQTQMKTYRGGSNWTGSSWPTGTTGTADTTTWAFDDATGLLESKTDASSNAVSYTYTVAGQIDVRTWARGVTTTYGYSSTTGELLTVDYSDSTPDLTYTYNRLGSTATVADVTGTRTFTYNLAGTLELQREDLPSYLGSRRLTYGYDSSTTGALGRPNAFSLGTSGSPSSEQAITYGYASDGRFNSLGIGGQSFAYTYTSDSHLVGTVTNSSASYTATRGYESTRDLLASIESKYDTSTVLTRFDYTHDDLYRRVTRKQSGTAFADYYSGQAYSAVYNVYQYNDRSELQTAAMYRGNTPSTSPSSGDELPGRRFEYRYDNIGNRLTSGATGSAGSGDDEYAANALNQYTDKENNSVRVNGTASTNGFVAVGGAASTDRLDRFWGATLIPANVSAAAYVEARVYAADPGGGTAGADLVRIGSQYYFVPKQAQSFDYDEDGNLTQDSVWDYTYDAENRLIAMQQKTEATTALGTAARKLVFAYDYLGRRVRKTVHAWTGSAYNSTAMADWKFIYNGWNLAAEYDGLSTLTVVRTYAWGLDLSGTTQGAGGVGGLLQIKDEGSGKTYIPTYDGNGNISALMNSTTGGSIGSLAAAYEYDPFGNYLRNETIDAAVADQPFRFSTKFTDKESGLVYYGYRYYSPVLGRFICRDPKEEDGGRNLYAFLSNHAINQYDMLGLWEGDSMWGSGHGSIFEEMAAANGNYYMPTASHGDIYAQTISYDDAVRMFGSDVANRAGTGEVVQAAIIRNSLTANTFIGNVSIGGGAGDTSASLNAQWQTLVKAQADLAAGRNATFADSGGVTYNMTVGSSATFQVGDLIATVGMSAAPNSTLDPYGVGRGSGGRGGVDYAAIKEIPGEAVYSGFASMDAAGIAMSRVAKQRTGFDPQHLEYSGAIFSYQENGQTFYGITAPTQGGLPYVKDGQTITPGAPITTAVPFGGTFVAGYHSHPSSAGFSDTIVDGNPLGDIPSLRNVSATLGRSVSLYVGRDGGFFGNKVTVEVATSIQRPSGKWDVTTRSFKPYP